MNHTIKGIFIVVAITSMLVVGANMFPLAQNTYASSHRHSEFKSQDNILNQKDDTYRSPGSQSSNVAIQESGNGNSPTAFSDQSNNVQQQNQPTSPPSSTTATLEITKVCTPSCPGTDFRIRVNDMPEFTLQSGQTQVVTLSPGTIFRVSEAIPEGFDEPELTGDCGGTIRAGQTLHCTITNFPKPPTSTCNPDKIGGQPATPIGGSSGCTAFLPPASPAAQIVAFEEQCRGINGFNLSGDADTTGLTCTFPSSPPT